MRCCLGRPRGTGTSRAPQGRAARTDARHGARRDRSMRCVFVIRCCKTKEEDAFTDSRFYSLSSPFLSLVALCGLACTLEARIASHLGPATRFFDFFVSLRAPHTEEDNDVTTNPRDTTA